jgi:hypothetical protein
VTPITDIAGNRQAMRRGRAAEIKKYRPGIAPNLPSIYDTISDKNRPC